MADPTVTVVRQGIWATVVCSDHGLVSSWAAAGLAGFDALGHAAHHHRERHPPNWARCWWCAAPATAYRDTDHGGMVAVCPDHTYPQTPGCA